LEVVVRLLLGRRILEIQEDDDGLGLRFHNGSSLAIWNPANFDHSADLVGRRVEMVQEAQSQFVMSLDDGRELTVDLRDEAFSGPEAMMLTGPNNEIIVWN
jgi:hypothetical protein